MVGVWLLVFGIVIMPGMHGADVRFGRAALGRFGLVIGADGRHSAVQWLAFVMAVFIRSRPAKRRHGAGGDDRPGGDDRDPVGQMPGLVYVAGGDGCRATSLIACACGESLAVGR